MVVKRKCDCEEKVRVSMVIIGERDYTRGVPKVCSSSLWTINRHMRLFGPSLSSLSYSLSHTFQKQQMSTRYLLELHVWSFIYVYRYICKGSYPWSDMSLFVFGELD